MLEKQKEKNARTMALTIATCLEEWTAVPVYCKHMNYNAESWSFDITIRSYRRYSLVVRYTNNEIEQALKESKSLQPFLFALRDLINKKRPDLII